MQQKDQTADSDSEVVAKREPNLTSPCRQLAPVVRDPGKSKKEAGEHRNEPQQQSGGGPISRTSGQPKPGAQQKEHEARFEETTPQIVDNLPLRDQADRV